MLSGKKIVKRNEYKTFKHTKRKKKEKGILRSLREINVTKSTFS